MSQSYHTSKISNPQSNRYFNKLSPIKFIMLLLALISWTTTMGQSDEFIITGRFKVDGGSNNDAKIVVEKNGSKVKTLDGTSRFEVGLDYQAIYVVSFVKDGYVTKRLRFDTHVPDSRIEYGFEPFDFTIEIFEQYDDLNMVVFNQPVGRIAYSELIDEFDYDTDYTKSIQAQIDQAMDEVEVKKEEKAKEEEEKQRQEETLKKEISNLTTAADKSANSGKLDDALKKYEEAAQLQDTPELQKKIEDVKEKIEQKAKQEEQQQEFDKLMADADAAMAAGDLTGAKKLLEQANGVMGGSPKVKAQLDKVSKELVAQAQQEEQLQSIVKAAEEAAKNENWAEAQKKAEEGLAIKSDPRLDEIKANAIAAQEEVAAAQAAEAELQEKYDGLLAEADKASADKNYEEAIGKYEEAQQLKDTPDVQQKLAAVKEAQASEAQAAEAAAAKEAEGEALLEEARSKLQSGDLDGAKETAMAAGELLGSDRVKDVLKGVEDAEKEKAAELEQEQQLQQQYNELVAAGNESLTAGDLDQAKGKFTEASNLKEEAPEAQTGLEQVEAKLKEQEAQEAQAAEAEAQQKEKFENLLSAAQVALDAGNYDEARKSFTAAGELFEDKRVDQGLEDIEAAIAQQASAEEAEAKKKADYDQLVQSGNERLAAGELEEAKKAFSDAQALIADGPEAAKGLEDVAAKELELDAQQAQQAEAEAQKKQEFEELLIKADGALEAGNYEEAKASYAAAGELFEDKRVDKGLKAAEEALSAQSSAEEQAAQQQAAYEQLLAEGQQALDAGELDAAQKKYEEALAMQDGEEPKAKLTQIAELKAAKEQANAAQEEEQAAAAAEAKLQKQFDDLLAQGDKDAEKSDWAKAEASYAEALALKDDEAVKAKLENAKAKQAELASQAQEAAAAKESQEEQERLKKSFDEKVAEADKAFNKGALDEAEQAYNDALAIMDDAYPKSQLEKIEEERSKSAEQAQAEREARFVSLIEQGDQAFEQKDLNAAREAYVAAVQIKEDEHAQSQLNKIMALEEQARVKDQELAAANAEEERFNTLVTDGDKLFQANRLEEASVKYAEALGVKEDDAIKKKVEQIASILKQRAAEQARASEAAQAITDERGKANEELSQVIMEEASKQGPSNGAVKSPEVGTNPSDAKLAQPEMGFAERPGNRASGGAVVLSEVKRGEEALETPSAQLTEEDKFDGMMKRAEIQQAELAESESQKQLQERYAKRKTVETEKVGNSTVTYVYINRGDFVTVYKKVVHNWGGVFFFIDDRPTNQRFWEHETQ